MTTEEIDAFCLSLAGAVMEVPWGADQVYKVGGKMFAATGPGGGVSFKANDVAFEMLVETGALRREGDRWVCLAGHAGPSLS